MENKEMDTEKDVPFKVYESAQARADKRFRLMWLLIVIMFVALVGTNAGWLIYESQYEDIITTVSQDAISDSGDAIINGDKAGSVIYGYEGETDSNN